jgi:hypothetical protein
MNNPTKQLLISIILNILLCIACLFIAYSFIGLFGKNLYGYDSLLSLTRNISDQEVLLKTLIQGYSKEKTISLIKKGIESSNGVETELKIYDDSVVFGETKIIFEDERVKDIEYFSPPEMERFKKLIAKERIENSQ